jgi:hypothetical protein
MATTVLSTLVRPGCVEPLVEMLRLRDISVSHLEMQNQPSESFYVGLALNVPEERIYDVSQILAFVEQGQVFKRTRK